MLFLYVSFGAVSSPYVCKDSTVVILYGVCFGVSFGAVSSPYICEDSTVVILSCVYFFMSVSVLSPYLFVEYVKFG